MKTALIIVFSCFVLCFPMVVQATAIINEEFEQVAFSPSNWTQNQVTGSNPWVLGSGSSWMGNNVASYNPAAGVAQD